MELGPNERSILAYFPSSDTASAAKAELLEAGYQIVQVDRVSRFGVNTDRQLNNPVAGQADTGTGLTLFSADTDQYANNDARVLMGADPSNSGMAAHDYGVAGGHAFMVTVVTQNDHVDQAVKILESHDGLV